MDNGLPAGSCGRTCRKISSASRPARVSPSFSPLPAGGQPRRLFSSSSRARVRYTRSGLIFGRGCVYPPLHPRRRPRRSMRSSRRHATKYRSGSPRCSIYYLGPSPGLRTRPRTIIPECGARGYPTASHSWYELSRKCFPLVVRSRQLTLTEIERLMGDR